MSRSIRSRTYFHLKKRVFDLEVKVNKVKDLFSSKKRVFDLEVKVNKVKDLFSPTKKGF